MSRESKYERKNVNTKNSTEYWKNVFKKWVNGRNFQANLEEYERDVLNQTLSQTLLYSFETSAVVPEIFKFEKCVKYANDIYKKNTDS